MECILPVQTVMCDNFKGWGNFAENVLGITSNVCILHATDNVQFFCAIMRPRCVSGIASGHRSHVQQFPDVAAYDEFFDIVVDTAEIGVDQFATRVQCLLVRISELATAMIPPTGVSEQQCLRGNNARKLVVWQAGGIFEE